MDGIWRFWSLGDLCGFANNLHSAKLIMEFIGNNALTSHLRGWQKASGGKRLEFFSRSPGNRRSVSAPDSMSPCHDPRWRQDDGDRADPEPDIDRIAERMGMPGLIAGATHHNC
jgi:hypothetical protein